MTLDRFDPLVCGAGSCAGGGLGIVLHDTYLFLSFVSVVCGAFLGVVGVLAWIKNLRQPPSDE